MEEQISVDFERLKPLCDKIARDARIEDMSELQLVIKQLDKQSVTALQIYLLFPFKLILGRNINEAVTIKAIQVLTCLFERCQTESWSIFSNYFLQLLKLIVDPSGSYKVSDASEEFKSSLCLNLNSLVKSSTVEVIHEMYQNSFRLNLGLLLFTLINLFTNERSKSLRKTILETIGLLSYNNRNFPSRSKTVEQSASAALASFLPGLTTALTAVIRGDIKQGEGVFREALSVLADLIVLVVGDACSYSCDESVKTNTLTEGDQAANVIKNEIWFKETASKLQIVMHNSTVLASHDNWKVRQSFLNFAESILLGCTKHLENCVPILLPAVFALSVDSYRNVASCARNLIDKFSKHLKFSNSMSLCSIIEDNIYSSTSKLIASKLSVNDDQKIVILRSILGYIQVLGDSVDSLLLSVNHLEKFIMSLISLLEFDVSSVDVVEEISTQWDVSVNPNAWPKKRFLYFQREEILETVCKICHSLGQSRHNRLLVDTLMEKMHSSELFLLQSIFLIGTIVEAFPENSSVHFNLVGDVIEELLSPSLWDLSADKDPGTIQVFQPRSSIANTVPYTNKKLYQICLILESIAKCAKASGTEFRSIVMSVLFNVMESAGSSNYILAHSGRLCLCSVSESCGYSSVLELIRENADYIVNSLTVNFHNFLYRPEMAVVLRVIIEESDGTVLPLFSDSINHVIRILDLNQDKAYPLLTVLKSVAVCIKRWFPPKGKNIPSTPVLSEHLHLYFSRKKAVADSARASTETDEVELEEKDDDSSVNADEEKSVPLHVTILSAILKRCSHLQSSRNLYIRVLSLEIMEICISALGDFEHQQQPMVHELWNPFIKRFSEEQVIVLQAFRVLLVIADECRDFVRSRVMKDVVPKLISLLRSMYPSSLLKNNFENYQWTNSCKLQLSVLSDIGHLVCKLDASEKDIALLAEVCLPYLQSGQPKVFQMAAFQTLEALATIDSDAIWWYVSETFCSQSTLVPPHESLNAIHLPHASTTNFEFKFDF